MEGKFNLTIHLDILQKNIKTLTLIKMDDRGHEEIILRLESAIHNKDWADIELLLDDLQIEEVDTDQGYDQFVDDDWNE